MPLGHLNHLRFDRLLKSKFSFSFIDGFHCANHWINMNSFFVQCSECKKSFKTTTALINHRQFSHSRLDRLKPEKIKFCNNEGVSAISLPKYRKLSDVKEKRAYKLWKESLVETINNVHNPRGKGMWKCKKSI